MKEIQKVLPTSWAGQQPPISSSLSGLQFAMNGEHIEDKRERTPFIFGQSQSLLIHQD